MAQSRKGCKDCGEPIGFIQGENGRWIPVDPGTEKRHVCQLSQTCESCEKTFQGAPWMKVCQDCYRSGGRAPERPGAAPRSPRTPEPLDGGPLDDDDAPPF